jgi:hypothetical protein
MVMPSREPVMRRNRLAASATAEPRRLAEVRGQASAVILRIFRRAGLLEKRRHTLRHTFGTHAALFGVNPWRLQSWMGHKRIDDWRWASDRESKVTRANHGGSNEAITSIKPTMLEFSSPSRPTATLRRDRSGWHDTALIGDAMTAV